MKLLSLRLLVSITVGMALYAIGALAAEVSSKIFSINGATVGVTTLDEVQKIYGKTESSRVSEETEPDVMICYVRTSSKGKTFLVFETGIMGSYKDITGFRISTILPRKNCATTNVDVGAMVTGNGVHLGQSLEDFKKVTPVEFKRHGSNLIYEAVSQRPATREELEGLRPRLPSEQDYLSVVINIEATFKDNRLIDFYVHKIESY